MVAAHRATATAPLSFLIQWLAEGVLLPRRKNRGGVLLTAQDVDYRARACSAMLCRRHSAVLLAEPAPRPGNAANRGKSLLSGIVGLQ
jgi:hypothetical protein